MTRVAKQQCRGEKCIKNTAVIRDVSIKQHDAATRDASTKYDECPALGVNDIKLLNIFAFVSSCLIPRFLLNLII